MTTETTILEKIMIKSAYLLAYILSALFGERVSYCHGAASAEGNYQTIGFGCGIIDGQPRKLPTDQYGFYQIQIFDKILKWDAF